MSKEPVEVIQEQLEIAYCRDYQEDAETIIWALWLNGYKIVPIEQKECSCP